MSHHYIVSVQQPTTVTHCIKGNFFSSTSIDVLFAKSSKLDIYTVTENGLSPICEVPIYGKIAAMCKYRPNDSDKDKIIICTEDYNFTVLTGESPSYQISTYVYGNIRNKIGRGIDRDYICIVDPSNRICLLYLYVGSIKIIPLTNTYNVAFRAYDIFIPELGIRDIQFLPMEDDIIRFALIYEYHGKRHIKAYRLDLATRTIQDLQPSFHSFDISDTACSIIPVSKNGHFIVCSNSLFQLSDIQGTILSSCKVAFESPFSWDEIDNGKFLLSDHNGLLSLIIVKNNELTISSLGRLDAVSIVRYLDNRVFYAGSFSGPSYLVRILSNHLDILTTYTNTGPITDMAGIIHSDTADTQMIGISGYDKTSAMIEIRSGIECQRISKDGTIATPSPEPVHYMHPFYYDGKLYYVLSYLTISEIYQWKEKELVFYKQLAFPIQSVLQTPSSLYFITTTSILEYPSMKTVFTFPSSIQFIEYYDNTFFVVSRNLLSIYSSSFQLLTTQEFTYDISAFSYHSYQNSIILAVSEWISNSLTFFTYSNQQLSSPLYQQVYSSPIKSIAFSNLTNETTSIFYCLLNHIDGGIRILKESSSSWNEDKYFHITSLAGEWIADEKEDTFVLTGPKPCLLYNKNTTWFIAHLDSNEILTACSFNALQHEHQYLYVDGETHQLLICEIDDTRSIHINRTTQAMNMTSILYDSHTNSVVTLSLPSTQPTSQNGSIQLRNPLSFDTIVEIPLHLSEYPLCGIIAPLYQLPLTGEPTYYFIVGTAFVLPKESEPTSGRLLLFQITSSTLSQVCEISINGGCFSLASYQGKLVAGINSEICIYDYDETTCTLQKLHSEESNICITRLSVNEADKTIAVGDSLRSVSLYHCTVEALCGRQLAQLELTASERSRRSIIALTRVVDHPSSLLLSDASGNIIVLDAMKESDLDRTNPQQCLVVKEWFHLDDQVNQFVPISLFQMNKTQNDKKQEEDASHSAIDFNMMFCTITGRIGAIGSIDDKEYTLLQAIEKSINKVIVPIGGLNHQSWRQSGIPSTGNSISYCIDGDLVEMFLEMKEEIKEKIVDLVNTELKTSYSIKTISNYLQDIRTKH